MHEDRIAVVDIRNPAALRIESAISLTNPCRSTPRTISGNSSIVVVAMGEAGLWIIDDESFEVISKVNTGPADRVQVVGDRAYVLTVNRTESDGLFLRNPGDGIQILDLSDVRRPIQLGYLLRTRLKDVAVYEDRAYVAAAAGGVLIFDVDP